MQPHRLVGQGRRQPQLHHLPRQQAQGPVFMSCRRGLQARAIRACPVPDTGWASPRSSSFRYRWAWGRSCSTPANPASAKWRLMRNTVPSATSRAWATRGADQAASVFSSIRARVVTRAVLLPARTRCSSWFRCVPRQPDSVLFPDHTTTSLQHFPESG